MSPKKVLYLLGITLILGMFAQNLFMPILPAMQHEFQTSATMINWTVSIFTLMLAIMQIIYGPFIDRFGRKRVMIPALILYMIASIGCYLVDSIYGLLFFRALQGAGFAAIPIVAATIIGDLFTGNNRASAMGTYQMLLALSPALGPLLGGWIGGIGGHSAVFLFLAISAVFLVGINATLLPETKRHQATSSGGFTLGSFRHILLHPVGASVILIGFSQMYAYYCFLLFLPVQLTNHYAISVEQIGLVFLLVSAVFIISSKLSALLQNRWGARTTLVVTTGSNALAMFLFMTAADVSFLLLVITSTLFALTLGVGMSAHTILLSEVFEAERATAIGVYNFIRYTGMAAGPVVGAMLLEWGGVWLEFGMAGILIALATLFARQKVKRTAASMQGEF
ncbi:putative MFS family arabinose efflux permease [Brevibacillus sp. AG162]|uniref:MFS transporter n=1 Tax=Brevibacillus sp. AG162 TaxID=2572910 RepID=UPI001150846F|nr:MFS transporter [Brevibacillus sp. AG162]TQK75251.1 putative MFS family arabinose efflux permease [Brevibacillus sp. AG162]